MVSLLFMQTESNQESWEPVLFGLVLRALQAFKKEKHPMAEQNYLVSLFINAGGKANCKIVPNRNRKWAITFEVVKSNSANDPHI